MIIEFSGADGTGKTTAHGVFCDRLEQLGARVLRTREVGNPHLPVCAKLREVILNPEADLDGRSMELIFAAMRLENGRFYERVADQFDYIVSDRGWLCHLAYTDHNVDKRFTRSLYQTFLRPMTHMPSKIYLFSVDSDEAKRRRTDRGEAVDAIEAKGEEFQRSVQKSYLEYSRDDLLRYLTTHVDANVSKETMAGYMRYEADRVHRQASV